MPTTIADQPQGPSLEDAASRMEGLLDLEEDNQGTQSDQAEKEAPAEKDEGVAEAEAKPEETTADEADTGKDEAPETDEDAKAADERDQTVTVKIDGKTETVTLKEALEGYQRHSDYARKTASLANERRALNEQAKAISDERQTYATMLVALRDQLQTQEPEPNWDEVYRADPIGYARKRDEWRDKQDKVAAASFELQRLHSLQQKDNAENLAQVVKEGRAKMLKLNPTWNDPKVWDADRQKIVEYAQTVGYSPEEIAQAYDPRAVVSLHKARLYDELMARKPTPVVTKGPRVASAGAVQAQGDAPRLNAAQQRLAKSGRIEDAAKVFAELI